MARCNRANTGAANTGVTARAMDTERPKRVNMDQLSDRTRNNYLYARAMVGRELAMPAVRPASMH